MNEIKENSNGGEEKIKLMWEKQGKRCKQREKYCAEKESLWSREKWNKKKRIIVVNEVSILL